MEKTQEKKEKSKVYNVIIMDRSGSMWDIQKPAIQGFNEVLGGVKADAAKYAQTQDHFISLVLFDSSAVEDVYWNADPAGAKRLTEKTYVPGACTPLYDAVGRTLTQLESELKDDTNHTVVVTIITDGYENASKEYSLPSVKALIQHLTEEGWSFAYMGTDHDVHGVSVSLSITNVIQFEKTAEKTAETFKRERHARERHARLMWEFESACPEASWEEKKAYQSRIARDYYEAQEVDPAFAGRVTPERVDRLQPGEIFVFGSNDKGLHAGGVARAAQRKFGAKMGIAEGPQGQSYAIPTVGDGIGPQEIGEAFRRFVDYAKTHPENTFLLTAIGCGHGGYAPDILSQYLEDGIHVSNIHYPMVFWQAFKKRGVVM